MVYRGKPSQSCAECRKRRNRCDLKRPSCTQCLKAGRKCIGYRDALDTMFCDQSNMVAVSSDHDDQRGREDKPAGLSRRVAPVAIKRTAPTTLKDFVFYQPLDDLAITFFMNTYVGGEIVHSQFDFLPALYSRHSSNIKLQECLRAVGLAAYAKAMRRPDLVQPATKRYVAALRKVNLALTSNETAVQDSTLICVLLLAMYEVMTRNKGLGNLTKHLDGAMAISILLLKQKQHSEFSERLLETIYQSVILNCWIQNRPLPDGFEALKEHADKTARMPPLQSQLLEAVIELINFRRDLHDENSYNTPSVNITRATALNDQIQAVLDDMPKPARLHHICPSGGVDHLAYKGYFHVYTKNFIAHMWNNLRSAQIRLHSFITTQSSTILSSYADCLEPDAVATLTAQIEASNHAITTLATEILATVPQLASYLPKLQRSFSQPRDSLGEGFSNIPALGPHISFTELSSLGAHDVSASTFPIPQGRLPANAPSKSAKGSFLLSPFFSAPKSPPHIPSTSSSRTECSGPLPTLQLNIQPIDPGPYPQTASLHHPPPPFLPPLFHSGSPQPQVVPVFPIPRSANLHHLLYILYMLSTISLLPDDMHRWISQRIAWVERSAISEDVEGLRAMKEAQFGRPGGIWTFPISGFAHTEERRDETE